MAFDSRTNPKAVHAGGERVLSNAWQRFERRVRRAPAPPHRSSVCLPLSSLPRREPPICQDHVFRIASNQAFPPATALICGFPASLPPMFERQERKDRQKKDQAGILTQRQTNMSWPLGGPGWITNTFRPSYRAFWRFRLPVPQPEGWQTNRCQGRRHQLFSNPRRLRPMTDLERTKRERRFDP